jgi:signal transduction histidine kinase
MIYVRALQRSVLLAGIAVVVFVQFLVSVVVMAPGLLVGLVFLLPPPIQLGRRLTNRWRALFAGWTGLEIPVPYLPAPPPPEPDAEGLYRHDATLYRKPRVPAFFVRLDWLANDPATKRDLTWQMWFPFAAMAPLGLIVAPLTLVCPPWALLVTPVGLAAVPWTVGAVIRWSAWMLRPKAAQRRERKEGSNRLLLAWARCGLLVVCAALQVLFFLFSLACFSLAFGLGIIFLIPVAMSHFRWLANLRRHFAEWGGVSIPKPYAPELRPELRPDGLYRVRNNLYKTEAMASFSARWQWTWRDIASWRDLLWLGVDPVVTVALVGLPVLAGIFGAWGLALPWLWTTLFDSEWSAWYGAVNGNRTLGLIVGLALVAASLASAPLVIGPHARWTALLLRPTRAAALRQRVERLTQTRTDAIDAQAAEVRRIERDLHDGAQARLISVGLTLGAIERLLDTDPAAARKLVAQAKETSAKALAELREVVRGILPPVLSERGLADAVQALALDSAAEVTVGGRLDGRPAAPVESAAYFAISELLANATRHGGAERITVDLRHRDGLLCITVTDDGEGGADPSRGTGLRGIERRLGTFDGTLNINSPRGGPTVATLELPCALSSPKTSIS